MWIYVFYICFFFLGRPSSGVNLLYWINAHSVVDSPPLIIRWLSIDQAVPYKEVDECYHCHSHVRLDRPLHLRSPASESTQRSYRSPFSWKIRPTQVNRWIKRKGKQGLHCGTERERSPILNRYICILSSHSTRINTIYKLVLSNGDARNCTCHQGQGRSLW